MITIKIIIIIILVLGVLSCNSISTNKTSVKINPKLEKLVEGKIIDTTKILDNCDHSYLNKSFTKFEINNEPKNISDSLKFLKYHSTWNYINDTLKIYGGFPKPDFEFGFTAKIIEKKAEIVGYTRTHILLNNLALDTVSNLTFNNLNIPTKSRSISLTSIPAPNSNEVIYGFVEFETNEFYQLKKYNKTTVGIEIESKIKASQKVYFKSIKCELMN